MTLWYFAKSTFIPITQKKKKKKEKNTVVIKSVDGIFYLRSI